MVIIFIAASRDIFLMSPPSAKMANVAEGNGNATETRQCVSVVRFLGKHLPYLCQCVSGVCLCESCVNDAALQMTAVKKSSMSAKNEARH